MKLDPEMLNLIGNSSIAAIVFVMWLMSFKQFNRQQEKVAKTTQENVERMFYLMEQDIKYKDVLTGILSRVEIKLDVHMQDAERK